MAAPLNKACMPAVTQLVEHLRASGTGEAKLEKLTELGRCCKNLDEFLEMVPNNVPAATVQKIDEYITKQVYTPSDKKAKKGTTWHDTSRGAMLKQQAVDAQQREDDTAETEGGGSRTETKDSRQSSIADHTILVENRAPVLKAGDKPAKLVGADVTPPEGTSPKDNDDAEEGENSEGSEEEEVSDVADLNAEEAKDAISRMRSKEKLQHIVDNDKRKSVVEAAEKRMEELDGSE